MLPERISDLSQLGPHAVASRSPAQVETPCPGLPTDLSRCPRHRGAQSCDVAFGSKIDALVGIKNESSFISNERSSLSGRLMCKFSQASGLPRYGSTIVV